MAEQNNGTFTWDQLRRKRHGLPMGLTKFVRENSRWFLAGSLLSFAVFAFALILMGIEFRTDNYDDPQLAPDLAQARQDYAANPRDDAIKEQIKQLDYAQRGRYFERAWLINLLAAVALASGFFALALLRLWWEVRITKPILVGGKKPAKANTESENPPDEGAGGSISASVAAADAQEPHDPEFIKSLIPDAADKTAALIPALNAIQKKYRYLPETMISELQKQMGLGRAHIDGVISFYHQYRLRPCGETLIKICVGTACHVAGAPRLIDQLKRRYGIDPSDDTSPDRKITIEEVACMGCCMLAPAAEVEGKILGPTDSAAIAADADAPKTKGEALETTRDNGYARSLALCHCSSCGASGSRETANALLKEISARKLDVSLEETTCGGESFLSPIVHVREDGKETTRYLNVSADQASLLLRQVYPPREAIRRVRYWSSDIVAKLSGTQIDAPIRMNGGEKVTTTKIAATGAALTDPISFDQYTADGGFESLKKLLQSKPDAIIAQIKESGLRGRGGAGFPTGIKWEMVRKHGNEPIVVCNGDEGDPGAFMDRMLLESFPFRVLEGMAIAAFATGASEGILYIRAEYPLAIERIEKCIRICEEKGILGDKLMGTDQPFKVRVTSGAGAFVCGEETALLASLEGERGEPRQRPPYPAASGAWGRSTLINNVESFCNVPWILSHGAEAFKNASASKERSGGTKTFALAGKINRPGLIEVPIGTSIREIIEEIGGGIPNGKKLKAVQIGGPSGGCVPASMIDTPIDYDTLQKSGSMMGSGGLVVLDEDDCMVDVARYFMEFATRESCGKCAPCRIGTARMLELLTKICAGEGKAADLQKLEELASMTKTSSLCGLGKTAPNPLVSTLGHFRQEYEAHLKGECPAHVCTKLIHYKITDECVGCTICARECPVDAIDFAPHEIHAIDQELCIKCDTCRQVCPEDAVTVLTGEEQSEPEPAVKG